MFTVARRSLLALIPAAALAFSGPVRAQALDPNVFFSLADMSSEFSATGLWKELRDEETRCLAAYDEKRGEPPRNVAHRVTTTSNPRFAKVFGEVCNVSNFTTTLERQAEPGPDARPSIFIRGWHVMGIRAVCEGSGKKHFVITSYGPPDPGPK